MAQSTDAKRLPSRDQLVAEVAALRSRQERLERALDITRLLAAEVKLDELLPLVATKTTEALAADRATIYLVDHERQELWTRAVSKLEIEEIRLPLGTGLAGHVAQTGVTLLIPDCYQDPRFDQTWDRKTGYRTRSMLLMPLDNSQGDRLGVFQVINKHNGAAFDYEDLTHLKAIAASAAIALENAQLYEAQRESFVSLVTTLASTVDARDRETSGHSQRVAASSEILARKLGLEGDDVERIRLAGLLHDYGKIGVPDAVLTKAGRPTEAEWEQLKAHPRFTRDILTNIKFLRGFEDIPIIAGQHHERLDGKGYPDGLHDADLTLGGRILAVADVYDALRMKRYYKPSFSIERALAIIKDDAGQALDFDVVQALEANTPEIEVAVGHLRPGTEEETERSQDMRAQEKRTPTTATNGAAAGVVAAGKSESG